MARRCLGAPAAGAVLLAVLGSLTAPPASAQLLMRYLPQSVPGYEVDPALAVLQNGGPDYRGQGVRLGDFIIRPAIDETIGFNDNPLGLVDARSSPVIGSAGAVSLNSDWSRDSIGASFNVDDLRYTALPIGDQTSYSAFTGGSIDIGRDSVAISGGRVSAYIGPTDVLSQGLAAPIPFSSNDVRIAYTAPFARLTLTPTVDFTTYQFGQPAGGADGFAESSLDKTQITAGLAASYAMAPGHNIVAAYSQTNAFLQHRAPADALSRYSDNLVLAGLDYDTYGPFRYDVLLGYEVRTFSGGADVQRQTPAAEVSVTWRPTRLTTVNVSGVRHLSDASALVANNLVYDQGKAVLYHELYRNIILDADVDFQSTNDNAAEGGTRTSLDAGGGATYLINPTVRLDLNYQFTQGSGFASSIDSSGALGTAGNRSFTSNLLQWSVHFGL